MTTSKFEERTKDTFMADMLKSLEAGLQKECAPIVVEAQEKIRAKLQLWVATIALSMVERADFQMMGRNLTITVHIPKPEDLEFLKEKP